MILKTFILGLEKQGILSIILFPFTIFTNINNFLLAISDKKINRKIFQFVLEIFILEEQEKLL